MRVRGPGGVCYGIELLDSSLSKIAEVESNRTFYAAVQKPGDGFAVRVYRCQEGGGDPPAQPMIIDCYLDGKSVGYSKKFQAGGSHSARFDGFRLDGDWRKVTSFVFAAPQQREDNTGSQDGGHGTGDLGSVKVVFIPAETYDCPGQGECHRCRKYAGLDKHKGEGARAPSMQQLPDGKKFYLAPSLGASTGRTIYRAVQPRRVHFRHAPGAAKITLTLRYETVSILALRKILDPAVPEHVALINRTKMPAPSTSSRESRRDPAGGVGLGSQNRYSQVSEAGMSTQGDDVKPESQTLDRILEHGPFGSQSGGNEEVDVKPRKRRRAEPPVYIDLGDDKASTHFQQFQVASKRVSIQDN